MRRVLLVVLAVLVAPAFLAVGAVGGTSLFGVTAGTTQDAGHHPVVPPGGPWIGLVPPAPAPGAQRVPAAAALVAVRFALAQLGQPYLWGGTGAGGYDCSGLVMVAYRNAGIALPRTANLQYEAGPVVPPGNALLPGDLVFFGPDAANPATIEHVGMYLGHGEMVDAPHTGAFVRVEPVWLSDYVGATRPAG